MPPEGSMPTQKGLPNLGLLLREGLQPAGDQQHHPHCLGRCLAWHVFFPFFGLPCPGQLEGISEAASYKHCPNKVSLGREMETSAVATVNSDILTMRQDQPEWRSAMEGAGSVQEQVGVVVREP